MTQDETIELARKAGVDMSLGEHWSFFIEELEAFAKLVEAKEREACARVCESLELPEWPDKVRQPLAQAIRARGQE